MCIVLQIYFNWVYYVFSYTVILNFAQNGMQLVIRKVNDFRECSLYIQPLEDQDILNLACFTIK
jgi:hypothetical protein